MCNVINISMAYEKKKQIKNKTIFNYSVINCFYNLLDNYNNKDKFLKYIFCKTFFVC